MLMSRCYCVYNWPLFGKSLRHFNWAYEYHCSCYVRLIANGFSLWLVERTSVGGFLTAGKQLKLSPNQGEERQHNTLVTLLYSLDHNI